MKILIVNKENKTTEISFDDEVIWQGFLEEPDTLEDILSALGYDIERIDHSIDDENLEPPEEEEYFDPFEV